MWQFYRDRRPETYGQITALVSVMNINAKYRVELRDLLIGAELFPPE
jgi:hypothetical protein